MISAGTVDVFTAITVLGSGIVAGVFFTFSTFVMKALAGLPPAEGIAAMQAINLAAVTPPFMAALFGSGLGAIALVATAAPDLSEAGAVLRLAGGIVYLLGPVGLTITYHVPRNDHLAALDPTDPAAAVHWDGYTTTWTSMNHLRTLTALTTTSLLTIAHGIA